MKEGSGSGWPKNILKIRIRISNTYFWYLGYLFRCNVDTAYYNLIRQERYRQRLSEKSTTFS